jgi:hypothetical protein
MIVALFACECKRRGSELWERVGIKGCSDSYEWDFLPGSGGRDLRYGRPERVGKNHNYRVHKGTSPTGWSLVIVLGLDAWQKTNSLSERGGVQLPPID